MINNSKHHKPLPLYGDGMQIHDWLYVENHCKAIDMVANFGKKSGKSTTWATTMNALIFLLLRRLSNSFMTACTMEDISNVLIKHAEEHLGHDHRYGIYSTKIKNDLGWYPETLFENGIVLTIDWYLNNEERMDHVTSGNYQKYYEEMYKNKAEV